MELKFINVEKRVDDTIVFPAFNLHTNERLTVIEHLKFFQQLYNNDYNY